MPQKPRTSWKRFLLEGFVIVVSILLAFSIDAWWNNRIDKKKEREHLISMRAEFQTSITGLADILASIQDHARNIEELIELLKLAGDEPVIVPAHLLGSAVTWRTSDVSTSTLSALMASGDLNLLRNVDLRSSLAGLPAFLSDVTEDEIVSKNFAENELSIVLARLGLAEIAYANRGGVTGPDGIEDLSAPSEIVVVPSPELIGLLTARRVHLWYSEYGLPRVQDYLKMVVDDIDEELATERLNE